MKQAPPSKTAMIKTGFQFGVGFALASVLVTIAAQLINYGIYSAISAFHQ